MTNTPASRQSTCPACGRNGVIVPLTVMGVTLYQFVCKSWKCGKTTNLTEDQAQAWMAEKQVKA